ncbi:MAG: dihydrofolate reductase family protein [Paracoccaceae bacterium]
MTTGHVFMAQSLDGFIATRDHRLDWLTRHTDPDEDHGHDAFMDRMDGIVMGRATFRTVAGFDPWPYAKPVIVLSNSLDEADIPEPLRAKVRLAQLSPRALMSELARAGWSRAYIDGGQTVQSFLRAGLISDLTLTVIPILLGDGRRLFGELEQEIDLELLDAKSFPSGLVQLHYRLP